MNKADKFVKRYKENNPDKNSIGCRIAIELKLFGGSFQDRFIPPEYQKALDKFYR